MAAVNADPDEISREEGSPTEIEKLACAVRFTLGDHQRLLQRSDVEDICTSKELCFGYSDRVRCGPCAIKQSEKHGVEVDHSLPFAPEQYRLQRRLRAAQDDIADLREALEQVVGLYGANNAEPAELRDALMANVERYRELVAKGRPAMLSEAAS